MFWVYSHFNGRDHLVMMDNEGIAAAMAAMYSDNIIFEAELTTEPIRELLNPRKERLESILELVEKGVLGQEQAPMHWFWHWPIKDYMRLPVEFLVDAEMYGEIRLY